MGLSRFQLLLIAAAATLLVAAIWMASSNQEPELNQAGPRHGDGSPIYLFQSYDCATCWNFTVNGELESVLDAAVASGRSVVWKTVAPGNPYGAVASHCVLEQFPTQWQSWNEAAFAEQLEPGTGWTSLDRILFMTESHFLMPQDQTQIFEACLYEGPWQEQVALDTNWWNNSVPLPALYADGQWHPATAQAIRNP
ncbi:MAG: hypothetical protein ACPHID_01915 [Thermoplasmatota archaeon]